jgi:hypothetical protein
MRPLVIGRSLRRHLRECELSSEFGFRSRAITSPCKDRQSVFQSQANRRSLLAGESTAEFSKERYFVDSAKYWWAPVLIAVATG